MMQTKQQLNRSFFTFKQILISRRRSNGYELGAHWITFLSALGLETAHRRGDFHFIGVANELSVTIAVDATSAAESDLSLRFRGVLTSETPVFSDLAATMCL